MNLFELATILNGQFSGNNAEFKTISIDSRVIKPGDCFIAIKGEFFDGHDFLHVVSEKKAAVAIVDRDVAISIPTIRVKNTRQALIHLASFYRAKVNIPVIAITGSCGKTTTRALTENILKLAGNVLASKKSFNNDIGLPLTLLQLTPEHDFAVLEIGTNHPGEIAALTKIAQPTITVITMVAGVHIEGFGSVENIAKEKGDIYSTLKTTNIAVINADDSYADYWKKLNSQHRIVTFGMHHKADVMAEDIKIMPDGSVQFQLVMHSATGVVHLPLLGEHNIINALAAASIAYALSISIDKIKQGLETAQPEYGRLNIKTGLHGATIIDDSYNANPASVKAAITLLSHRSENGILVLGDMKELGDGAQSLHADIGRFAHASGIKTLFCYGEMSAYAANAFGKDALHFSDQQQLIDALTLSLSSKITVLVKGSNSMKMINIVNAILF